MGVRKPLEKSNEEKIAESEISALINAGAKVKEDEKKDNREWVIVNVRISKAMLNAVDGAVERRVGITRTGWILEAIHEKLQN